MFDCKESSAYFCRNGLITKFILSSCENNHFTSVKFTFGISGRSLTDDSQPLAELGVRERSKLMLLGNAVR